MRRTLAGLAAIGCSVIWFSFCGWAIVQVFTSEYQEMRGAMIAFVFITLVGAIALIFTTYDIFTDRI